MLKPSFLEITNSSSQISSDAGSSYRNGLSLPNDHHIGFHDLDNKPYMGKVADGITSKSVDNGTAIYSPNAAPNVSEGMQRSFLEDVTSSENNINSSSGLITPPDISGTSNGRHVLPENVGVLIASRLNGEDHIDGTLTRTEPTLSSAHAPSVNGEKQPEFPPQFGLPSPPPVTTTTAPSAVVTTAVKSPSSLHQDLSTPILQEVPPAPPPPSQPLNSPEKTREGDTPSTVSPPASLTVTATPNVATKREPDSPVAESSPPCDDAEYAAAARAAVDSVVCALVGNKSPPSATVYDPSLMGTGTDRLYTLSLAPIGKSEPTLTSTIPVAVPACSHSLLLNSATQASERGLTSLTCPTCGVTVPVKQLLARQRPPEEAKHVCDTCGRSFVREDKLKRHIMSIHTLEKPHVCTICTKAFSRK